jgi:hypothetical protein
MVLGQEHVPGFATPPFDVAGVCQWVMAGGPTTIAVHASVDRIGQHLIDHFVAGTAPRDLRPKATPMDLMRQLQTSRLRHSSTLRIEPSWLKRCTVCSTACRTAWSGLNWS